MVIDTSAVMAILLGEPEAEDFSRWIAGDPKRLMSSLSLLEAAIVIHARKGLVGTRELDLLLHAAGVTIVSLDAGQVSLARTAYQKYGKGHHPAALNLGDCCSYALSRFSGEPLLFKGKDFSQTDVAVAGPKGIEATTPA